MQWIIQKWVKCSPTSYRSEMFCQLLVPLSMVSYVVSGVPLFLLRHSFFPTSIAGVAVIQDPESDASPERGEAPNTK